MEKVAKGEFQFSVKVSGGSSEKEYRVTGLDQVYG